MSKDVRVSAHGIHPGIQGISTTIGQTIGQTIGDILKNVQLPGDDFTVHKFVNNPSGGRPTLDYHLSLDMAKELAMVERNDKGKPARQFGLNYLEKM